jgi:hypothetical protein
MHESIEVAEQFAECMTSEAERREAYERGSGLLDVNTLEGKGWIVACWMCYPVAAEAASKGATASRWLAIPGIDSSEGSELLPDQERYYFTELSVQISLIRCVFGNPFRPVAFSPEWRTDTAISLARQMYDSREFSAMPILADALQDAGCDNDDILEHCRGNGPHVRGCWVVDLVLGKG